MCVRVFCTSVVCRVLFSFVVGWPLSCSYCVLLFWCGERKRREQGSERRGQQERERERQKQRERLGEERETERQRDRERDREKDKEGVTERDRQ